MDFKTLHQPPERPPEALLQSFLSRFSQCGSLGAIKCLTSAIVPAMGNDRRSSWRRFFYDFNSLKSLPNGIKQIDTYFPNLKRGVVTYISCLRWRIIMAGEARWRIIALESVMEALAYRLCGGKLSNRPARSLSYPTCSGSSLACALERFSLPE